MTRSVKHIHKLRKKVYKKTGNAMFFCILPDCHYKIEVDFALGKETICNICGDPFIVTEYTLRLMKPHCPKCGMVQIIDDDGKKRRVRIVKNKILTNIASSRIEDLRARLDEATNKPEVTVDEDI